MRLTLVRAACIAAILSSPWIASSQHYYVVVGAFAAEENASEIKGYRPEQVLDTSLTISERANLGHFYLLKASDKQSALEKTLKLKREIDSWNALQQNLTMSVPADPSASVASAAEPSPAEGFVSAPENEAGGSAARGVGSASAANAGMVPPPPVGKYFQFKIESPEGRPIEGKVHHVDFDAGRELGTYKSNTLVDLLRPGQTEPMAVVCGLFGYKEIEKHIDYTNPSRTDREAYVNEHGAWVIPYRLERVEEGDVSLMYNVSFYKDAAIMRKSSQTDLDELVKMMHSNPYYEITVHAHCNGKNKREIIAPGPNKNYFDVAGAVKTFGTAKDLTVHRAEAIRSYLEDNGVDRSRVRIFAWGGSDMLVRNESPDAAVNDRIEIEFTRD